MCQAYLQLFYFIIYHFIPFFKPYIVTIPGGQNPRLQQFEYSYIIYVIDFLAEP